MWLFLILVGVPILEIALFIQVGGFLGLWPTLGIVILTALIGSMMLRAQGMAALMTLQQRISRFEDPTEPLAHGAMILVSGVLLLTPGFFTDTVGLLLLLPMVRMAVFRWVRNRIKVETVVAGQSQGPRGPTQDSVVIDGDYVVQESDEDETPTELPRH